MSFFVITLNVLNIFFAFNADILATFDPILNVKN